MKLNPFAVCFAPLLAASAFPLMLARRLTWSALITIPWAMTPL